MLNQMAQGLNSAEAQERLKTYGWNTIPEDKPRPLLLFLKKFWGPVPWMLEISLVFELVLGRDTQAVIISLLLVFNAIIAFLQESRAQGTLALLQQKLAVQAKVLRDQAWQTLSAKNLVPGDIIHLRMGDFIPADVRVQAGHIAVDQSALTGESLPVDLTQDGIGYAGASSNAARPRLKSLPPERTPFMVKLQNWCTLRTPKATWKKPSWSL